MALTPSEEIIINFLKKRHDARWARDERLHQYVTLTRRIEHLGMAIPPEMRRFLVPVDWPRVVVSTIVARQQVRSLMMPGDDTSSEALHTYWDANNMKSRLKMFRQDLLTFGRAFISVGSNESNPNLPLIRIESPREIEVDVDVRREALTSAARFYGRAEGENQPRYVTLYMPNYTKWIERRQGKWVEVDVDEHNLGAVPIIMHLNRRWSGEFEGESELTGIIPITDSATRALTNMQFAQEAHGVPSIWATGVAKGDFTDSNGQPLPQFEAYYDVIKMLSDPSAKWGQFQAADLKNFETALRQYGEQAAITTGFPARYFGLTTANPATEGATIADEIQLVRTVEDKNETEEVALGWVMSLAHRFATGQWVEGNQIKVEHHNPATPTIAQREDALAKRRAAGVLSIEGYWDELGYSKARKDKERQYLAAEEAAYFKPLIEVADGSDSE